ncbi:tetratricopeptide repeat protein [Ancylomarina sp.]|uniref:tetratricopeptide repeat protein n=1 Tax=Ancylomarina sp. TaxID=1970196 RepID=UPI0035641AA8
MWKYASILILTILISSFVHAQQTLSVSLVNTETYALYQKQEWKQLILVGENSIKQGIDFYHLRLRVGIAHYELENYRKSAVFFQELARLNPEDISLKEYLYFSYLLSGRNKDAKRMQNDLSQPIREKYDIDKTKFISGIYTESKYEFIDDYAIDSDQIQQQTVRNQFHHYSLGLNHQLGKRLELFHAYSRVDLKNSIVSEGFHFKEEVKQTQYYLKNSVQIGWGTELVLAGHWVQTKVKGYPLFVETLAETAMLTSRIKGNGNGDGGNGDGGNGDGGNGDGGNGDGGNGDGGNGDGGNGDGGNGNGGNGNGGNGNGGNGDGGNGDGGNGDGGNGDGGDGASGSALEIVPYANTQNSFIGYMGLHQELSNWKVSLGLLYFEMNDLTRWQQEVSVRFYPKGNLNFYLLGRFTNQMEEKLEAGWLNRRYWKGGAGFRLAKNTWGQLGYSFGDMFKQVENEGYSVYNGVNLVKNRIEISLYQYLFKGKLNLFLLYQNQKEINGYIINDRINRQDINVQSITGGITWNF